MLQVMGSMQDHRCILLLMFHRLEWLKTPGMLPVTASMQNHRCSLLLVFQRLNWSKPFLFCLQARVVEDARHAASDGVNAKGKAISKRPDLVARSNMERAKAMANTTKVAGHVPGIAVFDRSGVQFYLVATD